MKKPITFLSVLLLFTFGAAAQPSGWSMNWTPCSRGWHDREQLSGETPGCAQRHHFVPASPGIFGPREPNAAQTRNAV
ncbi:MAG: hypothetical protein IPK21_21780 [Haliscomenobacter sp.]|nr:hypothetical protein [Haliscomenobacter sp.]